VGARERALKALSAAVKESLASMALAEAHSILPNKARRSDSPVCWSWIKLQEPCVGQLCLLQPLEFGRNIAQVMTGLAPDDIPDEDVLDAQTELTNIVAGLFLRNFVGTDQQPVLGLPRCGRGAPDVRRGEWAGQVYSAGDWWVALFITGRDVLGSASASLRMASQGSSRQKSSGVHIDEDPSGVSDAFRVIKDKPGGASSGRRQAITITPDDANSGAHSAMPSGIIPPQAPTPRSAQVDSIDLEPGEASGLHDDALTMKEERPHDALRESVVANHGAVPVVELEEFIHDHPDEFPNASTAVIRATREDKGTTGATALGNAPEDAATMAMSKDFKASAIQAAEPSERAAPSSDSTSFGSGMMLDADDLIGDGNFLIPNKLGNYRIIEQIGGGGMATVFRAEHATLLRQVAIKVLKPSLAADPGFVNSFLLEARNAARVEHPNVMPVYDADECEGYLYIVLRYVSTGDLATRISCEGVLAPGEACALFMACCQGLAAIAEAGLIHRDIKPANILMGEDGAPLIGDLGLTRPVGYGTRSRVTGNLGTPSYMAPEQLDDEAALDIRCDLYGLGGTLFTALTGHPPFRGKTPADTLRMVVQGEVPDPRKFRPELDSSLADLVMTALAKDPDDRFQRPIEFAQALNVCLDNLGEGSRRRSGWLGRLFRG
jgi:hypothetical protein